MLPIDKLLDCSGKPSMTETKFMQASLERASSSR
jgi:hypothetical protein